MEAAVSVKLLAELPDKAHIIKILNLFALHFKKAVGCQLVILILPTCLFKFSPAGMNLLVSPFFFFFLAIGWPIAIWFDTDLSKTNHEVVGTRQLAVCGSPISKERVFDRGFYFFLWSSSSE